VIAQVHGHALAGGCGLATVCDITFATPDVKMGYTEVEIGFIPAIVGVFVALFLDIINYEILSLSVFIKVDS
jgi:enoyl-CoA hydratase/carnithine racemase